MGHPDYPYYRSTARRKILSFPFLLSFDVGRNANDLAPFPRFSPRTPARRSRGYARFGDVQGERLVDQGPIKEKLKELVKG